MFSNLSIRAKLALILAPPLAALLLFVGLAVQDRFATASRADNETHELGEARSAMEVIDRLGAERAASVEFLVTSGGGRTEIDNLRAETDEAIAAFRTVLAAPGELEEPGRPEALAAIDRVAADRQAVDTFAIEQGEAFEAYTRNLDDLFALEAIIANGISDTDLLLDAQSTLSGLRGKEKVWQQIAFMGVRLELGELTGPDYVRFTNLRNEELLAFGSQAKTGGIAELWLKQQSSAEAKAGDELVGSIIESGQGGTLPTVDAADWWSTMTAKASGFDAADDASFELLVKASENQASSARTSAITFLVVGLLAVTLAITAALALARSIARRLQFMSDEAHTIATDRLPEVLESLRNPTPEALAGAMPTIATTSRDEIGVMAESFNTVLRTSVETSIEHSQQRAKTLTNMLINLGRRSQALIDRQLKLIDNLESSQEDPVLLNGLYQLDSLVTRNRRNSENLLVLAGEHTSRPWNDPVALVDLVRGAMSEVNGLERVNITSGTAGNDMVLGKSAVDLSHLIAELLENALSFSAKTAEVIVRIEAQTSGHRIWVIDNGMGMSAEEMADANQRLTEPPEIDELTTDRIGFQVVGRLANRLGVTVMLQDNPNGGTAACVDLPQSLLLAELGTNRKPSKRERAEAEAADAEERRERAASERVSGDAVMARTEVSEPDEPPRIARPGLRPVAAVDSVTETDADTSPVEVQEAPIEEVAAVQTTADGLKRRTPGAAFVGDRKAEEADGGAFRRLGSGKSKKKVDDPEARKDMLSNLKSGVEQGRTGGGSNGAADQNSEDEG